MSHRPSRYCAECGNFVAYGHRVGCSLGPPPSGPSVIVRLTAECPDLEVALGREVERIVDREVQRQLAGLLTEDEHRALDLSCELANLLKRIIGDGPQAEGDNAERCLMIHAIQRTIMSQAAARAFPEKFRLLGGRRR